MEKILSGYKIISLALNVPGPAAIKRLISFGAEVTKIEPPNGDPLREICYDWYEDLTRNQTVLSMDLKRPSDREQLEALLETADLLLTSMRPTALKRLLLDFESVRNQYPDLCQIAVTGYSESSENAAGHDLNYQAALGLVAPPHLPNTLLSDLAGAERIVAEAFRLFLARSSGKKSRQAIVSLSKTAEDFTAPIVYGLTCRDGFLGGSNAAYNLYETKDGWIALAVLERHFQEKLKQFLDIQEINIDLLKRIFITKTTGEWVAAAVAFDLPLTAVKN